MRKVAHTMSGEISSERRGYILDHWMCRLGTHLDFYSSFIVRIVKGNVSYDKSCTYDDSYQVKEGAILYRKSSM